MPSEQPKQRIVARSENTFWQAWLGSGLFLGRRANAKQYAKHASIRRFQGLKQLTPP